jgi:drug/metabolite transporter (DMT)-like permease
MTPRQLALLLVLAALWGASFLFMRVAAPAFGPIVLSDARVALAAAALVAYAAVARWAVARRGRGAMTPAGAADAGRGGAAAASPGARRRDYLLLGAVNAAIPFALLSAAELEVEASLAAVLMAVAPLTGAVVAAVWFGQPITAAKAAGLVLGVIGVALLVGLAPVRLDATYLLAVTACLAAAFAYGVGANLARERFAGEPPMAMAIGQQLAAAVVLLPLVPFAPVRATPDLADVLSLVGLAVASTSLAYLIYFRLIAELGAPSALTVTFLVPVFGVLWGALFLGEDLHLGTLAGGAVILLSVGLATGALSTAGRLRARPAR